MTAEAVLCTGFVAAGYEPVAEVFAQVLGEETGAGAQFAAYADGKMVLYLHGGGCAADTLLPVFSGTKGLLATCVAILVDRGRLDIDAPVAAYWPEFAASGKADVLVRHILSHQAGLPHIEQPVTDDDLYDEDATARRLARQRALWPPGREVCYHPLTYGWLAAELAPRGRP